MKPAEVKAYPTVVLSANRPVIVIDWATTIVTVSYPFAPRESVATIVSTYVPAESAPVTDKVFVLVSNLIFEFEELLARLRVPFPPFATNARVVSPRVKVV